MTGDHDGGQREGSDLRQRLIAIVAVALIPVAALSFFQGLERFERERLAARSGLVERAYSTAAREQSELAGAEQVLKALSRMDAVKEGGAPCDRLFQNALIGLRHFVNLARTDARGAVLCAALPQQSGFLASETEWWKEAEGSEVFTLHGPIYGRMSQREILVGALPFIGPTGEPDGYMTVAIDFEWLRAALLKAPVGDNEVFALVSGGGKVIASSELDRAKALFKNGVEAGRSLHTADDERGEPWSYAAAPLTPNGLSVVYGAKNEELFSASYWRVAADFLTPLFALLFSSVAIWLATDRMITRWIVDLRRISAAYAKGKYAVKPSGLDKAPVELRRLGADLAVMAASIAERDQQLRLAVAQKTNLIRAIHHRVKNNLQIVISLLSVQMNRTDDPGAREALERANLRIGAIGLVLRMFDEMEDRTDVDVRGLLNSLCDQMKTAFAGMDGVTLDCEAARMNLHVDSATPLALLTVEAISNSYRHAFPDGRKGSIIVRLKSEGGRAMLSISDDGVGVAKEMNGGATTGVTMIDALARQLGATLKASAVDTGGHRIEIDFPLAGEALAP